MKRINVTLPEATLAVLERLARKGDRSRFISSAVLFYVKTRARENLRARLKQEALANAERDVRMATEWFPLEEESWRRARGKRRRK